MEGPCPKCGVTVIELTSSWYKITHWDIRFRFTDILHNNYFGTVKCGCDHR